MNIKKFKLFQNHQQKGFTLIELLIVIVILGILAAIIVPNIHGFIINGHVASATTELDSAKTAAEAYYADNSSSVLDFDSNALVTAQLLSDTPLYGKYTFNSAAVLKSILPTAKATSSGIKVVGTAPNLSWSK